MSGDDSEPPSWFYDDYLKPQGHAAAVILVLIVLALLGGFLAVAMGRILVPRDLAARMERPTTEPVPPTGTPTVVPPTATVMPTPSPTPYRLAAEDWDIPLGHFFSQTSGQPKLTSAKGYSVTNVSAVPFWNAFRDLGGVPRLGYPLSRRFLWRGRPTQVFQWAVFHWREETRQVDLVNTLDELTVMGKDEWLLSERSVPVPVEKSFYENKTDEQRWQANLSLLDSNLDLKNFYTSLPDGPKLYGLPVSPVADMGNHYAIRLQRGVLQVWKQDVPWAAKGQVTLAHVGLMALDAGLFPRTAQSPEDPPEGTAPLMQPGSTPTATLTPTPVAPVAYQVINTGERGAGLRRVPGTSEALAAWPDGTRVAYLGEEIQTEGAAWKKVRDPQGNVGWIPSMYLAPAR